MFKLTKEKKEKKEKVDKRKLIKTTIPNAKLKNMKIESKSK